MSKDAKEFISEEKMRKWINKATYVQLLKKNREASFNDPMMQGTMGKYFRECLANSKSDLTTEEIVALSND